MHNEKRGMPQNESNVMTCFYEYEFMVMGRPISVTLIQMICEHKFLIPDGQKKEVQVLSKKRILNFTWSWVQALRKME